MGESVISALLEVSGEKTILTSNLDIVNQSGVSVLRAAEIFIKIYGPIVIYFVVALLITIYLARGILIERKICR